MCVSAQKYHASHVVIVVDVAIKNGLKLQSYGKKSSAATTPMQLNTSHLKLFSRFMPDNVY